MKIKSFFFALLIVVSAKTMSQDEEFKPSGAPYAKIFLNFHSDITDDGLDSQFEVTRAYFGYKYNLSKEFSTNVLLDVGLAKLDFIGDTLGLKGETSLNYTAFLKGASFTYKNGNFKVDFGLITLKQFKLYEDYWGHRYLYKTFQDNYGLGHSADFGFIADYKISDFLSIDLTVRNGEGFKSLETNNAFLTGFGYTLTPVEGLVFRGYYDYYETSEAQVTLAHFLGYQTDDFTIGAEYSWQLNNKQVEDADIGGFSAFGSYNFSEKVEAFGRVDLYKTKSDTDKKDGTGIIGGIQYSPISKIQFALNYQGFINADSNVDGSNAIYLNMQLNF